MINELIGMFTIDFHYWTKKYEEDYPKEVNQYPIFFNENNIEQEEKSPYFDSFSKAIIKRGYWNKESSLVYVCGKQKDPKKIWVLP